MDFNFDEIIERRGTDCAKWDLPVENVLPMWVADMDFLSAEPVIRALHERIDHGVFGYGLCPDELIDVIRARLQNLYGWQVAAEEIVFCPGVVTGFNIACRVRSEPGDGVLVQPPVYYPFFSAITHNGCKVIENQLVLGDNRDNSSDSRFSRRASGVGLLRSR